MQRKSKEGRANIEKKNYFYEILNKMSKRWGRGATVLRPPPLCRCLQVLNTLFYFSECPQILSSVVQLFDDKHAAIYTVSTCHTLHGVDSIQASRKSRRHDDAGRRIMLLV